MEARDAQNKVSICFHIIDTDSMYISSQIRLQYPAVYSRLASVYKDLALTLTRVNRQIGYMSVIQLTG